MTETPNTRPPSLRREKEGRKPFATNLIGGISLISGGMLALAIPNLISDDGAGSWLKTALLAGGATLVGYAVNRLAIERGAPLANAGYPSAVILSTVSIIAVGAGMFSATYSGLTYADVEKLRLEDYSAALSRYVADANEWGAQASTAASSVQAIASDLGAKLACEVSSSCLSGVGKGGHGKVARALEGVSGKAQAMAAQIGASSGRQRQVTADLYGLLGQFQEVLADPELSSGERRQKLYTIDGAIKGAIGDLGASMPMDLLLAYANELAQGVAISGRPEVQQAISTLLQGHGSGLSSAMAGLPAYQPQAPAFPAKTGVSDTFGYIAHFAPIAAIAAVTELILPLSLWLYTYLALHWAAYQIERPTPRKTHPIDLAMRRLLPGPEDYAPGKDTPEDEASADAVAVDDPAALPQATPPDGEQLRRRGPGRPRKSTPTDAE